MPLSALALCLGLTAAAVAPADRLTIACTTGMIADVVTQVAGSGHEVVGICGPGVDPHTYKPTRRDVARLMSADVVFYNGLGLEARMADVLIRLASRGRRVVAVTAALDEEFLLEPPEFDGHHDPHVWNDPAAWLVTTVAVRDALAQHDPPHAEGYRLRAAGVLESIERVTAYARECYASIPAGNRVLITSHDAFSYLGRAFDLEVLGIQGVTTESEAGLADIERLVDLIVARRIPAIFTENITTNRNVLALVEGCDARGWEVAVGGEVFSDAFGEAGTYEGSYVGMVDHNATVIARALGGRAPARGCFDRLRVGLARTVPGESSGLVAGAAAVSFARERGR